MGGTREQTNEHKHPQASNSPQTKAREHGKVVGYKGSPIVRHQLAGRHARQGSRQKGEGRGPQEGPGTGQPRNASQPPPTSNQPSGTRAQWSVQPGRQGRGQGREARRVRQEGSLRQSQEGTGRAQLGLWGRCETTRVQRG